MGTVFGVCGIASLACPPTMGAIVSASGADMSGRRYFMERTLLLVSAGVLFMAPRLAGKGCVKAEEEGSS